MSASTGTVNTGLGARQLGVALAGVGLAIAVAAGLAFGGLTASSQGTMSAAPRAAPCPPPVRHSACH